MSFKITAKDLIIEVDTQDEFSAALRAIRALDEKPVRHQVSMRPEKSLFPSSGKPVIPDKSSIIGLSKEERLNGFYEYVKAEARGNMLKFINALAVAQDFLTPQQIGEKFNIITEGIGGTVGSITKVARRYNLLREDILLREHSKSGSRFKLTPAMREIVLTETQEKLHSEGENGIKLN